MVERLENLFILIECSERLYSKEGPFLGLGADKIYTGRFQKSQKFIIFVNFREERPLLFLKPFRIILVLSKHVLHLVRVAHIEIKKDEQNVSFKHRKNCVCSLGHSLTVSHKPSMSGFKCSVCQEQSTVSLSH